jgi:hypothetical protein
VQTPLSDDPGTDFTELLDTPSAELSAGSLEEDSAELELDTAFAELLTTVSELELTFAELDVATNELDKAAELSETFAKQELEDKSTPTAAGKLSESPHAVIERANKLTKPAAIKLKTDLRKFIIFKTSPKCPQRTNNIHQKTQPSAAFII